MGASGSRHAREVYDWAVVLPRIQALFVELALIRREAARLAGSAYVAHRALPNPRRRDPFYGFSHYSSLIAEPSSRLAPGPVLPADPVAQRNALERHLSRPVYQALKAELDLDVAHRILQAVSRVPEGSRLAELAGESESARALLARYAGWLLKTGLIEIRTDSGSQRDTDRV
jgi:hypothetical protein